MKTWRERIVEARERGKFTARDINDSNDFATCFVGECVARYGVSLDALSDMGFNWYWDRRGESGGPSHSTRWNNFDLAERLLDAIEDRALQLKREAHA